MRKVIIIAGATGVGKSGVAEKLALHFNLPVINADASQMHYWMEIGTANIDEYSSGVRYELYNFFEPMFDFSIKDYQDLARTRVNQEDASIVCGGSGLYIDALCLDLDLKAKKRETDFSSFTNDELFAKLEAINPSLASKTHVNNRKRVERYLEVALSGDAPSREPKEIYDCLFIHVDRDREELYKRIDERCLEMFENGWIDEASRLERKGFKLEDIKEIGYASIGKFLHGEISKEDAIEEIQKDTRHYAKRQLTWFRACSKKYKNYITYNPNDDINELINKIERFLKNEY